MYRRYLTLVLALVIVFSTFIMVSAVPTNNEKMDWLIDRGIIIGDAGSGELRLSDTITRAEAAAVVVRVQGLEGLAKNYKSVKSQFPDVPTSHWANGYINIVASNNVVNGYLDGTFKPDVEITYAEVIKMLVAVNGDIPAANSLVSWQVPYIQKALQVGILEGIAVESYEDEAVREKIFEMVQNVMTKVLDKGLETYKAIVIENTRVNKLDKDELAIKVIEKDSSGDNYRYDTGSYVRIKLKDVHGDRNYLLGKVIDININQKNEVSRLTIDETYSYLTGPTTVNKDKLTINGKTYVVRDTYEMDKVEAVIHNDIKYRSMKEYFDKVGNSKEFITDFSNVTLKENTIYFIDSFSFEDIAPIKEIFRSDKELHIYRDDTNGTVTSVMAHSVLGYTEDGFKSIELKDIKANDVAHIYDRHKVIVRTDAIKVDVFDVDAENQPIVETNKRRPVYSLDGIRFFTLFENRIDLDLDPLRDEKVTLLFDLNNNLQSIIGNIEYDEGVFLIEKTDRRSVNVIGVNNANFTIVAESDSVLNFLGSYSNRTTNDYIRGDLVYLMKEGAIIDKMVRMDTASKIIARAKTVAKSDKGSFQMGKSWIVVEELRNLTSNFRINNSNVFILEMDGNKVLNILGTTLDYVIKNVKPNSNLKAYVVSNKDLQIMNLGNSIKYKNEANVAHTIIFTNFENTNPKLTKKIIKLAYKFTPGSDKVIEGKDIFGTTIKRTVDKYTNLPELKPGDIVKLGIDDDKTVLEVEVKVSKTDEVFKVIEISKYSSTKDRLVVLEDSNKDREYYYILRDAIEFDDVKEGDKVSISLNNAGDIDVIVVRP